MNGERSADLKTPGQCVMRPHLAAVSYLINKSASAFERCSGIPSALKTEFKTESAKCARETAIPSHFPSSRSLLSSPVSPTHPCCLAPLRSAPLLVSPSSRRLVSSQLSSARLSSSQSPASLRCPPSPSKQYN